MCYTIWSNEAYFVFFFLLLQELTLLLDLEKWNVSYQNVHYGSLCDVFSFRNCISNPRLSSNEILYASFFCNGIRETLLALLQVGHILNESSPIVSSDAEVTKKVAHQWQYSQTANWRLYSLEGFLIVLTENKWYIFHHIWRHLLWYL